MLIDVGKGLSFEVSDEQFNQMLSHDRSRERIMYIAIRNIVMDSHASIKRDDFESEIEWRNESKAVAERTIAGLLSGEVMRRNARAPKADDFTNFARKEVLSMLSKEKRKELAAQESSFVTTFLDSVFLKNETKLRPIVQAKLEAAIAAAKAKAEIASELDLDI